MPDYSKGKIYKIVNDKNDKIYFGSTCQSLSQRMGNHRGKQYLKLYTSNKLGVDLKECKIILVENVNCNSKEELLKRERYYIENFDCVNKNIPGRTLKEYYQENKDKLTEKGKIYRQNNKKKIYEKNKKYNEKNKDKITKWRKQWREKNRDKIREKGKEKITCDCGCLINKKHLAIHKRTKKHIKLLQEKQNNSN